MEDPTGFLHYRREEAGKQLAGSRVRHWHEYEQTMPDGQASLQARRCMDCGTPYCHSYCPVHNLIPDWNTLVNECDWQLAYEQLESTNNFPEFTGRICSAPCETACTLSIRSRPVTIRSIELAVVEHAWQSGWIRPRRNRQPLFKRVAIIGSGPAPERRKSDHVDLDERGTIAAQERDYMTSRKGVFCCGDARRGQSLVVWAIREGRQCARAIDCWLSGDSTLPQV